MDQSTPQQRAMSQILMSHVTPASDVTQISTPTDNTLEVSTATSHVAHLNDSCQFTTVTQVANLDESYYSCE